MKLIPSSLVLISLLSFASLASAAPIAGPLTCSEPDKRDDGYSVYVAKNGKSATVSEVTIAGANVVAVLKCRNGDKLPKGADIEYTMVRCYEPKIADGGYSLAIRGGGFTGLVQAKLSSITLAGAQPVATLSCGSVH